MQKKLCNGPFWTRLEPPLEVQFCILTPLETAFPPPPFFPITRLERKTNYPLGIWGPRQGGWFLNVTAQFFLRSQKRPSIFGLSSLPRPRENIFQYGIPGRNSREDLKAPKFRPVQTWPILLHVLVCEIVYYLSYKYSHRYMLDCFKRELSLGGMHCNYLKIVITGY